MDTYQNVQRLLGNGVVQSETVSNLTVANATYCEDELNEMALWGGSYDIGGPFHLAKSEANFPPVAHHAQVDAFGLRWTSDGPIMAAPEVYWMGGQTEATLISSVYNNAPVDPIPVRSALGSTAVNRCRPAQSHADISVSVIEMYREGIPQTLKSLSNMKDEVAHFRELTRANKGRTLPSKYLEYEFGWKPLVADIRKASKAILESDRILEDLRRNSGRRMRRSYSFPATSSTTLYKSDGTGPWPYLNSYLVQQTGGRTIDWTKTKKTWFSGEFVYTYPSAKRAFPLQMISGANKLLGIKLTPEVIWNIAPWTWLSDWFTNTGDIVANLSAIGEDNLVMRYGYLMQEASSVFRHTHRGVTIQGTNVVDATISGEFTEIVKTRIGASPFGFGLTYDGLDARQLAILGAIGLTNRRH